jgi:hypothetical protein
MNPDESDLIGQPVEGVPEREPDYHCNGRKTIGDIFEGYCQARAGKGTDHVGRGRCKHHGGGSPRGEDSPHFEHGLFSDHLSEEDRAVVDALDEYEDAEKLEELINWRLVRLRRALRELSEEEEMSFWDAFQEILDKTGSVEKGELRELAKMLNQHNRAMQNEIDLIRKLIKDHSKIVDGEDINLGWREALASAAGGDNGAE